MHIFSVVYFNVIDQSERHHTKNNIYGFIKLNEPNSHYKV